MTETKRNVVVRKNIPIENKKSIVLQCLNSDNIATKEYVDSSISSVNGKIEHVDENAKLLVEREANERVNQYNSVYNEVDTIKATVNSHTGSIENVEAELSEEKTVRANQVEALSQTVQTISSKVDDNKSLIQTEITARTNSFNSLSQKIETVEAKTDDTIAQLQYEVTARTSANNAIINQVSTLSARIDDTEATITDTRTIAVQAHQWSANASTLITDSNGKITGWKAASSSSQPSSFEIFADKFKIYDTDDNSKILFDNGVWRTYGSDGRRSELSGGSLVFYDANGNVSNYVKRIEAGVAQNGDTVTLTGFYDRAPTVQVSINDYKTYESDNTSQDQRVVCSAQNLTGSITTGEWSFYVKAESYISAGQNTAYNIFNTVNCGSAGFYNNTAYARATVTTNTTTQLDTSADNYEVTIKIYSFFGKDYGTLANPSVYKYELIVNVYGLIGGSWSQVASNNIGVRSDSTDTITVLISNSNHNIEKIYCEIIMDKATVNYDVKQLKSTTCNQNTFHWEVDMIESFITYKYNSDVITDSTAKLNWIAIG